MAIRTKGRRPFDLDGRKFVWDMRDEIHLRIASCDKRFSVAYELVGNTPLLKVSGHEFPGIDPAIPRPVWIVPPPFKAGIGPGLVREIVRWSLDPSHEIEPYRGPAKTALERAWDDLS